MRSMNVLRRKCEVQFVMFHGLYKSRILLINNKQFIGFLQKQNWTVSTDVNVLGLGKTSSVAYNPGKTQTCNDFLLFGRDSRL